MILGIDVPAHLDGDDADTPFTRLSAAVLTTVPGSCFVGHVGEAGTGKVAHLIRRGARMFVVDRDLRPEHGAEIRQLIVPEPRAAFETLCGWIAAQHDATTIAVTGSVGKTSTKEMIQLVCSADRTTLYSKGNQNGVAQVGRHIQRLTSATEVYVQETGAARPGLVESGARMLHPDAFVITNIGVNHIGHYGGSQENILKDKISHDRYLPPDGVAFVNYDDPVLRTLALRHRIVSYAIDDREARYYAEDVIERDGRLTFAIVESETGERTEAVIHAVGRHNVGNAVVAFAVGRWLGIPAERIVRGIGRYRGEGLRQNLTEIGGQRLLVDCYNASELAMISTAGSLRTIAVHGSGRRILVFGDIDDKLGDITEDVHRRVGRQLAEEEDIHSFAFFGAHAGWAAEETRAAGRETFHTTDRMVLHEYLARTVRPQDVVAFKGGQQMALSITIDALFGSSFVLLDGDVLLQRGSATELGGVEYRTIREYGAVAWRPARDFDGRALNVSSSVDGVPVYMVGRSAFANSALTSATVPEPVRTLAPSAFYRSRDLESVSLPGTLRVIGRSAFNGCRSLREVTIPDGVTTIGARAFFRCDTLERVRIPASVRTIEEQVFSYSLRVAIECEEGSFAERFCREAWPKRKLALV